MKKRVISLILVIVLALSLCVSAGAAYTQNVAINYRAIKLVLNGERIVPCDGAGNTVATVSKELFRMTDTYVIDVRRSEDALCALMLVLAIDAEKCSRN